MRRTLPIALAASAGAAVSATPADAYDSVNAATHDGHNDPKSPKPEGARQAQPPPARQAAPPPERTPATDVSQAVSQVATSVKHSTRPIREPNQGREHQPRHRPQIGRQADPPPSSVTAVSHEGYDAPRRERTERRPERRQPERRPQHQPATSSVTALSHDAYDPEAVKRRERRRLRASFPDRGPQLEGYKAPPVRGGQGEKVTIKGACVRRTVQGYPCRRTRPKQMRRSLWSNVGQTVVLSRSGERVALDGRRYETITLTRDRHAEVGVDGALRRLVGGIAFVSGERRSWEAIVRARHAERLAEGDGRAPDPTRPGRLRTGEGVLIRDDDYEGSDATIGVRALFFGDRHTEADRTTGGVQRLGRRRVRVYVGDEEIVEEVISLGAGAPGAALTQQMSRSFASGKLHSVDIRIGSEGGRRAYERYLETGVVPRVAHAGVGRERFLDTATWGSSSGPAVELLGQSHQELDSESGGSAATIQRPGREDVRTLMNHFGDVTVDHSFALHSGGRGRASRYSLLVENSVPEPLNQLLSLRGKPDDYEEPQDVRLSFSAEGLKALRQQAIDRIAVNREIDPASVEQQVLEDPDDPYVEGLPHGWDYELALAASRHPADILGNLYTRSKGNAATFYEDFNPVQLVRLSSCLPAGRLKVLGASDTS